MQPLLSSTDSEPGEADVFTAELVRLQSEVRQVNQQLDRLETEVLHALSSLTLERFEEYR
jgi:hypothetical protein